jgi:putative protease
LGKLNELRRMAVSELEEAIIDFMTDGLHQSRKSFKSENTPADMTITSPEKTDDFSASSNGFHVSVRTAQQLGAISEYFAGTVQRNIACKALYIDSDLLVYDTDNTVNTCRKLHDEGMKIYFSLPYIIRLRDDAFLERLDGLLNINPDIFDGIQVRNIDGMGYAIEKHHEKAICADAGFYIWNKMAVSLWQKYIDLFCMPYELKTSEQRDICKILSCEKVVYGRIPMMLSANCIANTVFKCLDGKSKTALLKDRYNKEFPTEINCRHCMNIIYNSVVLSLHGDIGRLINRMNLRLDFTIESRGETEDVLRFFETVAREGAGAVPPYRDYTTGHEKRGVE